MCLARLWFLVIPITFSPSTKIARLRADDLCGEFLKRVPSGIADFGVQFGYFQSDLISIGAASDLARESALKPLQSLFPFEKRARVFKFLALAGRGQCLNAHVYAYFGFGFLQWF